jgi:outer membrane usher protein
VGTVGGHAFLSRDITDSFGVVRVADFPEVRVLHDNQVIARTDSQGYAVLPRLRAYDRNPIAIDSRDLPFDASLGALRLHAAPYYRSGVFVEFPVRRIRAATLRVVLEDGSDLPSGALARIEGRSEQSPVALRGQAYLEGLERDNRLVFTWRGQRCTIDVSYPPGDDPLPDLGTYVCKGVKP